MDIITPLNVPCLCGGDAVEANIFVGLKFSCF